MANIKNIDKVLIENNKKNNLYFRDYNPCIGDELSEVVDRFKIAFENKEYYLPKTMLSIKSIALIKRNEQKIWKIIPSKKNREQAIKEITEGINRDRFSHDFEFWSYLCVKIQDKETKQLIRFKLNRGQRRLIHQYEQQRLAGKPIRLILVKARQWGGSTATQIYMLWLQTYHYRNWHSAIISQLQPQAINIRNMITKVVNNLPAYHPTITLRTFEGQKLIKWIPERGNMILTNSAEQPDAVRSFDFSMIHMSEVALWPDTATKSGDDIAQAIYATVPDQPGTFIVMESTAKGIGTFFHKQYLAAQENQRNGIDGLVPLFVPWFEIAMYRKPIHNLAEFISTLSEYEVWQWEQGATLEGINWYRSYKKAKCYTDFQMKSEFPTTANEAFQSKASKYFSEEIISKLRTGCRSPKFIGEIRANGTVGKQAMENIHLNENSALISEVLKIWVMPNDGIDPLKEKVTNRFVVIVDVGGKHYKSDNSVITVLDRFGLSEPGGTVERAGIWYGHVDPDILAWLSLRIAKFYNNALLVIESNTIDSRYKKETENFVNDGQHVYTVLDELKEEYDNLYMRPGPIDSITGQPTMKIGWNMNKQTKYLAYDNYSAAARDDLYIERDHSTVDEAEWLQIKPNGQIEALDGQRDDKQDTTAIGVYLSLDVMPPVKIINIEAQNKKRKSAKRVAGVATL